ncbi:radical SAM protein [bacterium]|nr:radical SAM protein [candidate division CSSED10-310 bacterium]
MSLQDGSRQSISHVGHQVVLVRPYNRTSMLIPNHGLGYLATGARRLGLSVAIEDFIRDRVELERIKAVIAPHKPLLVGIQVYTFDLPGLGAQIAAIRQAAPDAALIAGGPHPSADPQGFLEAFPHLHGAIAGEAELGFPNLAAAVVEANGWPAPDMLVRIPGLVWRSADGAIQCNPRAHVEDLDSLGLPAWDLIDPLSYPCAPQGTFLRRLPYAPIIVTRGCPHQCTFCAGHVVSGRRLRTRSIPHVIQELRMLVDTYGIREFHIQDDNFTHSREYVLGFCNALQQEQFDLTWACPNGIRLDTLDHEVLQAMERAGCYSVAVGIEAGTQRVLNLMKKRLELHEARARIALIRKTTKMRVTGFFILGYPGETLEEMKRTVKLAMRLDIDKVNFGILMPLPGTEVHDLLESRGLLAEIDLGRMSEYRSPYSPPGIDTAAFRRFFRRSFIFFYARPRIIYRFVRDIKSLDQLNVLWHRLRDVVTG